MLALALAALALLTMAIVALLLVSPQHGWTAVLARPRSRVVRGSTSSLPQLPSSGILVSGAVIQAAGINPEAVWDALNRAAEPLAVEYFPIPDSDVRKYRTVPVNSATQGALADLVKAVNPRSPTLYRVVLPEGMDLVKAAGSSGFRGFSRTGGKTAHAVLKPVGATGALAAGWPVLALAGTVMAVEMAAQRDIRAHHRHVETLLDRQEDRYLRERLASQRSVDEQLTRAISLMLDGHHPHLESALESADREFHYFVPFLEQHRKDIRRLIEEDGKVDYHKLDELLGGKSGDVAHFFRELRLASVAISLRRKAIVADAASLALKDPDNPYTALRKFIRERAGALDEAETAIRDITTLLGEIKLKGGWSIRKAVEKQAGLRQSAQALPVDGDVELLFLQSGSGGIRQVVSGPDEDA